MLGENLKNIRIATGITQVELAKKLGLKQAPSLVVYNGDEATVISDLPAVKEFIENM